MARWKPITNLRSNIIHHPPVAVFFMCLLLLAGAFISIGIYSKNHDIRNPDISMDWNQMLGSLADLKFCTQLNDTDLLNEKPDMNSPPLLNHADELINNTQKKSVFLLVTLRTDGDYMNYNSISDTLLGSQLGLKGSAGKQTLNVTLYLHVSATESSFIQKPLNMQAKPQFYDSCLRITAPNHILPQTPLPPQCPSSKNLEKNIPSVRALAIKSGEKSANGPACFSLEFTPDPKLTVFLTQ
ncbi:insulin-like growth factor-binding protein 3 receptor, partial [Silurus meridionalis]